MYQSGKSYGHEAGFSCAFRQWRAKSHCQVIHGYALAFKFIFESDQLDENNWIVDFGALKPLKVLLEAHFDHKLVVASDDPHLDYFRQGQQLGVFDLVELPATGCEKFAEYAFTVAQSWLNSGPHPKIDLVAVTVAEHGANHATYINPKLDISKKQTMLDRNWSK